MTDEPTPVEDGTDDAIASKDGGLFEQPVVDAPDSDPAEIHDPLDEDELRLSLIHI